MAAPMVWLAWLGVGQKLVDVIKSIFTRGPKDPPKKDGEKTEYIKGKDGKMYRVRPTIGAILAIAFLGAGCNNPLANLRGDELLEMCAAVVPPCEPCPPQKQCPPAVDEEKPKPPEPPEPPVDEEKPEPPPSEKRAFGCAPKAGFYLIDSGAPGPCGTVVIRGAWKVDPVPTANAGNTHYVYKADYSPNNVIEFTPNILKTGKYEVWVGYVASHAAARNARFEIVHRRGKSAAIEDQFLDGEVKVYRWRKLGTWEFKKGKGGKIILHDDPSPGSASERIDVVGLKMVK